MRPLIRRVLLAVLLTLAVPSSWVQAQDAEMFENLSQALDCTSICGSRLCCVASEIQVPLCIGGVKNGSPEGGLQCLGDPSKLMGMATAKTVEASLVPTCKIGCCDPLPTVVVFRNRDLFERALSTVPASMQTALREDRQVLLAMANPSREELRSFVTAVSSKLDAEGYCLFCCKWDF